MRSEYQARIDRVTAYIDMHLSDDLSLEKLASVACFSEYHFHRLFRGMVGESVSAYVQRRRLETAARSLYLNSESKVIDAALNVGYENPASFFKAFKRFFGLSPSEWREHGARTWTEARIDEKNRLREQNSKIGNVLDPKTWEVLRGKGRGGKGGIGIRELPESRIIYRRYIGRYGSPAITQTWGELMEWAQANGILKKDSSFIGILHDDPSITAPDKCRYDACLVIDADFQEEGVLVALFRGGKYLAYDFVGTPSDVDPAWDRVYREFLVESSWLADARPNIEIYPPQSIIDPEKMIFRSQLCVAVTEF